MPMDRSLYPPDWDEIAAACKRAAGWCCQNCGTPHGQGPGHRTLTVHHRDHDPANNDPSNLVALCAACHLAEERKWKRSAKGHQPSFWPT